MMTTKERVLLKRKQKREKRLKILKEIAEFLAIWFVVIVLFLLIKSDLDLREDFKKLKGYNSNLQFKLELKELELKNAYKDIVDLKTQLKELEQKNASLTVENQRLRKEVSRGEKREMLRDTKVKTLPVSKNASALSGPGWKTVIATGYCSCSRCCGKSNGITASGTKAHWGTIAAPRSIPFGTKVVISAFPGMVFTVEDRGGAITGNRIDIWFPSHSQALAWGKRAVKIKILR